MRVFFVLKKYCKSPTLVLDLLFMKNTLWKFTDDNGSFISKTADKINSLYFPLCNNHPLMSSISPNLHGDIKTDFNSFLLEPVSRIDLTNLKSSRNFWVYISKNKIWSITGASKDIETIETDEFTLESGLLWQSITRQNKKIGLKAQTTLFVPATGEPVEIMFVEITNTSSKSIKFIPTAAIPLFARSAHNGHDHRHVTSLLSRVQKEKYGVIVTPTLLFDETGHKKNLTSYFVLGISDRLSGPQYIYPTQEEFTSEASDLEAPDAIYNNRLPDKKLNPQGREPMAALRFKAKQLNPKETCAYIILMGIVRSDVHPDIHSIFTKFNSVEKAVNSLEAVKSFWRQKSREISTDTSDKIFDNWFHWVNVQPILRKIFGCSYLPDFDYGKGGRGWRDLWQDCLCLILNSPGDVRSLLVNNFSGVRIDGSNATIIGAKPGEFIADRNNISRVWMDHGIWPLVTVLLYINQTQDFQLLFEETPYFRDHQLCRGRERDWDWKPEYGKNLKTKDNRIYTGSVLEHILIQNLVQFFNVGPHNHIRLEGADWNDGLDMAAEYGESVAFSAMYAQNLNALCEILEKLEGKEILLLKEQGILLDSLSDTGLDYSDISSKQKLLESYFQKVKSEVSGEKISVRKENLISDLRKKAAWISKNIRETEWLKEGFFNGYYDNNKQRVEGKINGTIRITLTGQTFPVMSGIASKEQTAVLFKTCKKYLQDKNLGGFRLNSDFKKEQLSLGRAFSFVYGEKENGAFFNHMCVMFAYALYKQEFVQEGFEVMDSIYRMSVDTGKSKIYPCLPEYFNAQGKGMYSYLTGSASWFILTVLTQMFGVRGEYGDLRLEPKLTARQFKIKNTLSIITNFAEKRIEVKFVNQRKKDFGKYTIRKILFNGELLADELNKPSFLISRKDFLARCNKPLDLIEIILD